jgi:DNA-binding winged helix-turn-helix (wHTH) protein/transposase
VFSNQVGLRQTNISSRQQRVTNDTYDDNFRNLPPPTNSNSPAVTDELFAGSGFFDVTDIVQVKYEMLRRVAIDGISVRDATHAFGFSRQAFYLAKADFEQNGLPGLLPFKRGPKESHKLTGDVLDFIRESRANDPSLRIPELTRRVKERFGIEIHQQSIRRALGRIQERLRRVGTAQPTTFVSDNLEIDFAARRVRAAQKNVHLTPTEFDLLRLLFSHAGHPIPHRKLVQWLWGRSSVGHTNLLRVYVNQLRKKIEPDPSKPTYILTEPCVGYCFVVSNE